MVTPLLLLLFLFVGVSLGLNNGLGRLPQMGMTKRNYVSTNLLILLQAGIVGIVFIVISMKN
jgi:hypothetical protein